MASIAPDWFNPADYFTYVLDQEIRDAGMPGGYCGLVLKLAQQPDLMRLQQRLDLLVEHFPKASAQIQQIGKRFAWQATGKRIELQQHVCPEDGLPEQVVTEIFNRPNNQPLSVHWIAHQQAGSVLICWLHPLLDARGAKLLLDFLGSEQSKISPEAPSIILEKLAQWSWWKKLSLLLKAKRHNHQANRVDSCSPTLADGGQQRLQLKVQRFDAEQSKQIALAAQANTGMAGRTLYYLGCFMRAMEQVGPPAAKAGYCIPYAFNLRRQNAPRPLFGNHVGCLFARADRQQVQDRVGLFAHLLSEHKKVVRDELDLAYLPLMWLGQWLSPARYAKLLRKQHSGNELSSLWFSDLGDMSWGKNGWLGIEVVDLSMLCWMTLPPGLALLVGQLDGRLSLSYSYLTPAVDEVWLDAVMACMAQELLG